QSPAKTPLPGCDPAAAEWLAAHSSRDFPQLPARLLALLEEGPRVPAADRHAAPGNLRNTARRAPCGCTPRTSPCRNCDNTRMPPGQDAPHNSSKTPLDHRQFRCQHFHLPGDFIGAILLTRLRRLVIVGLPRSFFRRRLRQHLFRRSLEIVFVLPPARWPSHTQALAWPTRESHSGNLAIP